jgi:predicted metal-binding membrane protein
LCATTLVSKHILTQNINIMYNEIRAGIYCIGTCW